MSAYNSTILPDIPVEPELWDHSPEEEEYDPTTVLYRSIAVCAGGTVALLGMFGSGLAFTVLRHEKLNHPPTLLLKTLLSVDLGLVLVFFVYALLITAVHQLGSPVCGSQLRRRFAYVVTYCRFVLGPPLVSLMGSAGAWCTVLVCVNRYFVVCRAKLLLRLYSINRTRLQIGVTLLVVILFALPLFLSKRVLVKTTDEDCVSVKVILKIYETPEFYVFEYIVQPLIQHVVPLVLLIILNVKVILTLRSARKERRSLMQHTMSVRGRPEEGLTRVITSMVSVSIITLVLQLPLFVFKTYWAYLRAHMELFNAEEWNFVCLITASAQVLYVANATANFVVYFLLRKSFRQKMKKLCWCCYSPGIDHRSTSYQRTASCSSDFTYASRRKSSGGTSAEN